MKPLSCIIGIHRWGRPVMIRFRGDQFIGNWMIKRSCARCGVITRAFVFDGEA